jgi:predicted DCC family thiol-disulfide oxidoreductase YuxK
MAKAMKLKPKNGWIFYDGDCAVCVNSVAHASRLLRARGFEFAPMQEPWAAERLGLKGGTLPNEFVVISKDGTRFGGASAILHLSKFIWWARPFAALFRLPPFFAVFDRAYRWFAARRYCISGVCQFSTHELAARKSKRIE